MPASAVLEGAPKAPAVVVPKPVWPPVLPPPKRLVPLAGAPVPKAGFGAVDPNKVEPPKEPPADAVLPNPPKPPPPVLAVVVAAPPPPKRPPPPVVVVPKAGFAPKPLVVVLAPKPPAKD